jgi:hypothetical protein
MIIPNASDRTIYWDLCRLQRQRMEQTARRRRLQAAEKFVMPSDVPIADVSFLSHHFVPGHMYI